MKIKLELMERIDERRGLGAWKHVVFVEADTAEGHLVELISLLNSATRFGFQWKRDIGLSI